MIRPLLVLLSISMLWAQPKIENDAAQIKVINSPAALWRYELKGERFSFAIAPPICEIDGKTTALRWQTFKVQSKPLFNGVTEYTVSGPVAGDAELKLEWIVRLSPDNPVVRFCYRLTASSPRFLTKNSGENLTYFVASFASLPKVVEVRLSEYDELVHCYLPAERAVEARFFDNALMLDGPILVGGDGRHTLLLAYEHGSQLPDRYLGFQLSPNRQVGLKAVKGNYWSRYPLVEGYETLWMDAAAVKGGKEAMASQFRLHVLKYFSPNLTSRKPYIFYNTWNYQERNYFWNGKPYLDSMNLERMLQEIEVAHRMGIEVFVIDTGWYQKTGDWQVSLARFPDSLRTVKAKLDGYGMKLGLWFNNTAAVSSTILQKQPDCKITWDGKPQGPYSIWETEESYPMCLVSKFADAYADELIRLSKELGVTYFKWDAIGQYGCNDPNHFHGDASVSAQERGEAYSFLLSRYMKKIVDKLCAACPEAIVDFDVTEGERAFGLEFLAAGKYFIMNNGPYYVSFDDTLFAPGGGMGANVFVFPGPARARVCRAPLVYDKWIPSVLFLTHYLPDDPLRSQYLNLGSLILGQNGIWGDLLKVSEAGVETFHKVLGLYKQVREDMALASPVRTGSIGGVPEIHEKINPGNGRGAVVLFFNYKNPWVKLEDAHFGGTFRYVTANAVAREVWHNEGVKVTFDHKGRAVIEAECRGPEAKVIFFGVKE
ncbi:MAG: alpha-galactosidase [candidate division KSB1 bacterium]|nr:alpha-galactosidase [candidate division KSB1 bacterium]